MKDLLDNCKPDQRLLDFELRYRRLFETAQDGILILDGQSGKIQDVNPFLIEMLGYTHEELVGKKLWEIGLFKGIADSKEAFEILQNKGYVRYKDLPLKTKDGKPAYVEFVSNTYKVGRKKVIQCNIRDITEHKKGDEALGESEAFSTSLFMNSPNPILVTNLDHSILQVNSAFETLTGYSSSEVVGLSPPFPWWPPERYDQYKEIYSYDENSPLFIREWQYRKKNGDLFWVTLTVRRVAEKDIPKYYLANWVDITERKLVEEELIRSKKNFILAAKLAHLGPWEYDPEKKVFIFNDEFYAIYGTSVQQEGMTVTPQQYIKKFMHPDDANLIKIGSPAIQSLPGLDNTSRREHRIIRRDGQVRYVAVLSRIIKDTTGKVIEWYGAHQDITESKIMEERILDLYNKEKKQREELQEEAKARSMFTDILAHELRTPLTPVLASTGMLNELISDKVGIQGKLVANIYTGVQVLCTRLEELLEVARYSRGTFQLNKQPVAMGEYLHTVISRFKPSIDQQGQILIVEIAEDLPVTEIDSSRFEQVIVNLLSNASKFSPQNGHVTFRSRVQDDELLVEIQDEGIGISPEESLRIFQPYHRVEQDRLKFPGLGLGLAVSKQIVDAHGGKIWVESQEGKGSKFCFTVPLR